MAYLIRTQGTAVRACVICGHEFVRSKMQKKCCTRACMRRLNSKRTNEAKKLKTSRRKLLKCLKESTSTSQ